MNFFIFSTFLFYLYNCQVLTNDRNLPPVLLNETEMSLGITPILINAPILANMFLLKIEGTLEISNEARRVAEVDYNINWAVNGVPTIFPTEDVIFIVGSDVAPTIKFSFTLIRMGMEIFTVDGTLLKSGSITEGDILSQVSLYKGGQSLGLMPITLDLMATSQRFRADPMIKVDSLVSYIPSLS